MQVYHTLSETPADFGPSALTIGNFDGLHKGHRGIIRRVVAIAREHGWKPSVLTFDPHPTRVVAPERTPSLLTSPLKRAELMREEGIEQVLILPFDRPLAALTPEEFVRTVVAGRLGAKAVFVGENFRFGRGQAGDVRLLAELGRRYGFTAQAIPAVSCRGRIVSSSGVRELVRRGEVSRAARYLERPYSLCGEVVRGRGVGSQETVPTLNLETTAEIIPANGVYVTRTSDLDDGRRWRSISNIGYRPTFGESEKLTIETFLLDPLELGAPRRIEVEFLWRVRPERRFEDSAALKQQILRDVAAAGRFFRRLETRVARPTRA
jgi:riboflavin kinase / FMN adenylyltransferase